MCNRGTQQRKKRKDGQTMQQHSATQQAEQQTTMQQQRAAGVSRNPGNNSGVGQAGCGLEAQNMPDQHNRCFTATCAAAIALKRQQ
jgi:hypothetical protein